MTVSMFVGVRGSSNQGHRQTHPLAITDQLDRYAITDEVIVFDETEEAVHVHFEAFVVDAQDDVAHTHAGGPCLACTGVDCRKAS